MKKKNYLVLISFIVMILTTSSVFAQKKAQNRYVPRKDRKEMHEKGITGAMEFYHLLRRNPETGEFHIADYYAARQQVEQFSTQKSGALNWRSIGPTDQGGRVRGLIFDKNNPEVMYAGAVSGGIWKTTNGGQSWQPIDDLMPSLIVSCMDQAPDGIIYFGTGEGFAQPYGTNANTGFVGMGLFRSTDATGTAFVQIPSTDPATASGWELVYEVKIHPNGDIYAATERGIKKSTDNGATWTNPLSAFPATASVNTQDVDISPDGNVIVLVAANKVYISTNGGVDYFNASTGGTMLPVSGLSRIEVDIAPSNPMYIYASAAKLNGYIHNIYRSTDGGQTWTIIGPGGSTNFDVFRNQGRYNNVIKVHPTNPDKIYLGGIDNWTWEAGGNWEQKSLWFLDEFDPFFLHADHHSYAFYPNNPNIIYYGTDGGVAKSTNGGITFTTTNRNFTTLQAYAMAVSKEGMIMTGTQDNGTNFMDRKGFVEGRSVKMLGGDGGYCAFSFLNEKLLFGSVYYGDVRRTPTGESDQMDLFYDSWVQGLSSYLESGFASFVTPLLLHEKIDDYLSPDSVTYTHTGDTVWGGDTLTVFSNTSGYPFSYVLPSSIPFMVEDDKITVQDIVTSKFYVGLNGYVIMTRDAHNFASQPKWWPVAKVTGTVQSMAVSQCGNYVFVGTSGGRVFRISNLNHANDSLSACAVNISVPTPYPINPFCVVETKELTIPASSNRPVTNIAIDPNDPSRVVVVLGSYGTNLNYVYYSSNAIDETPTFVSKQGALPRVPVYSALIEMTNPNTVLLGTEFGIYMTTNITAANPTWTEENDGGIARVPVFDMKQQTYMFPGVTNYGVVYAATHGRGVFESTNFVRVPEFEAEQVANLTLLEVYPNPASDVVTIRIPEKINNGTLRIFNISGKMIHQVDMNNYSENTIKIDVSTFNSGVYFIDLTGDQFRKSGKFVKIN